MFLAFKEYFDKNLMVKLERMEEMLIKAWNILFCFGNNVLITVKPLLSA